MRVVFPASAVYVCLVVGVVLLAITAVATVGGVTNATAVASSSNTVNARVSPAAATVVPAPANNSDQYICYLCQQRNTLMIKWCPLDVDDCHIACLSSPSSPASTRALAPPGHGGGDGRNPSDTGPGGANPDDCYVMKLYPDGTWFIVEAVSCRAVAGCYHACGNGDAAPGSTSPAVAKGTLPPFHDAKFQRCGDQLTAAIPAV